MPFSDRASAAFFGLALGDAYGRTLEFLRGASVRTTKVSTAQGDFIWTDDTHMALYLAEAVRASGVDALHADAFGIKVGEAFSRWLADPFRPHTAPGTTCIAGARSWERGRNWRTSGVSHSDGCGAVMRICPLGIALAGEDLTLAAKVSAAITHGHPNAADSAVAASHLLRWTLEFGRFDAALVQRAIALVPTGSATARALAAAITMGSDTREMLDESAIPEGDGGWRSPSALGLAVAAALKGGTFAQIVDRAARIDGDSDSVACLAGMYAGAAKGMAFLPAEWVKNIHRRDEIQTAARQMASLGEPLLAVADLHGHAAHFDALMAFAHTQGNPDVVLLGDYCDNGPEIVGLIRKIMARPDITAIMGNHDLAALRALGWPRPDQAEHWFNRWNVRYGATLSQQLGARTATDYAHKIPDDIREWLEQRPWVATTDRYCFVHAGMQSGGLSAQVGALQAMELPENVDQHPAPISMKELATNADPSWDRVVVSGHKNLHGPAAFVGANRICLSAEVDVSEVLHAVLLPERRFLRVGPDLVVRELPPLHAQE